MKPSRILIVLLGALLAIGVAAPLFSRRAEVAAGGPGQGPGYISIGPAAFQPSQSSLSYQITERDALALVNTSGVEGRFYAPVSLPHGATLTHLNVFYADENLSAGEDGRILLSAWAPLPPRSGQELVQVTTVNGEWVHRVPVDHRVNNGLYNYAIAADLYPEIYLYGVLIEFRFEATLPLVVGQD